MRNTTASALTLWRRSGSKDPALPAVLEFQWPSTAIINAPIPRSARGIVWMITSMVVVLIAASAIIPVDQVVTARGIVVSKSPTILVQPLDTAIVRSIDVREGQQVRAGTVLARLDPTFATADFAALDAQVADLEAEVARLQAEAQGKPFGYTGLDPHWTLQAAIYGHRMAQLESKVENYRHRLDELSAMIARAQSDAAGYSERLGVAAEHRGHAQGARSQASRQPIEHAAGRGQSRGDGPRFGQCAADDRRRQPRSGCHEVRARFATFRPGKQSCRKSWPTRPAS